MGEDKRGVSSVKNPNAVFVALGVVAVAILVALMVAWSHIGYHRPAIQSQSQSDQVSSQPPSGRGSVSENQQSGVPPVKPVDTQKPSETPGDEKDPVPPAVQPVDGSNVNDGRDASVYIVQPGDTLSSISATTGVSVDKIAQANSLVDVNRIYKESALVIPPSQ